MGSSGSPRLIAVLAVFFTASTASLAAAYALRYDATAPEVTASLSRAADHCLDPGQGRELLQRPDLSRRPQGA
jgi:hypothetical protein